MSTKGSFWASARTVVVAAGMAFACGALLLACLDYAGEEWERTCPTSGDAGSTEPGSGAGSAEPGSGTGSATPGTASGGCPTASASADAGGSGSGSAAP